MKKIISKVLLFSAALLTLVLCGAGEVSEAATLGKQFIQPEAGWTRYDDCDSRIVYDGNWILHYYGGGSYLSTHHHSQYRIGCTFKFEFFGSDVRILNCEGTDYTGGRVKIDGVDYGNFNSYIQNGGGSILFFEKLGLARTFHKVEVTTLNRSVFGNIASNNNFCFDAIDIGAGGELVPYSDDIDYGSSYVKVDGGMSNVSRGQEFELEVKYFDDENATSLFGQITYNKNLLKLEELTVRDGLKLLKAKKTPGEAVFSLTSLDKAPIGNGSVIKLKFKALASGQAAVGINKFRAGKDMCIRTIDNRRCFGKDIYVG